MIEVKEEIVVAGIVEDAKNVMGETVAADAKILVVGQKEGVEEITNFRGSFSIWEKRTELVNVPLLI